MTTSLPSTIATYIRATNDHDTDAVLTCFTHNATVEDDGEAYHGLDAIRAWSDEAAQKYGITIAPLGSSQSDDEVIITALINGNFEGAPLHFTHYFTLEGDKIARLTIE